MDESGTNFYLHFLPSSFRTFVNQSFSPIFALPLSHSSRRSQSTVDVANPSNVVTWFTKLGVVFYSGRGNWVGGGGAPDVNTHFISNLSSHWHRLLRELYYKTIIAIAGDGLILMREGLLTRDKVSCWFCNGLRQKEKTFLFSALV